MLPMLKHYKTLAFLNFFIPILKYSLIFEVEVHCGNQHNPGNTKPLFK
jgi:hypothetical protein